MDSDLEQRLRADLKADSDHARIAWPDGPRPEGSARAAEPGAAGRQGPNRFGARYWLVGGATACLVLGGLVVLERARSDVSTPAPLGSPEPSATTTPNNTAPGSVVDESTATSALDAVPAQDSTPTTVGTAPAAVVTTPTTNPPVEMWVDLAPDTAMVMPDSPLRERVAPAAVWTGEEMIIWGGSELDTPSGEIPLDDGAAFRPATGTWRTIAVAPVQGRAYAGAVWTGDEMIVWGGSRDGQTVGDGAAYDPAIDTWRTLPAPPVDTAMKPSALWTGREAIFVGGMRTVSPGGAQSISDAAAYDPATNQWRALASLPCYSLPPYPQAVWTGSSIVSTVAAGDGAGPSSAERVRYNPEGDRWDVIVDNTDAVTLVATPTADDASRVVALPGQAGAPIEILDGDGNPVATLEGRPQDLGGTGNYALPVWTGTEILFWAGSDQGWAFEPDTGQWRTFPAGNVANRVDGTAVWADGVMIAWGGFISNRDGTATAGADGIIYRPPPN